MTEKRIGISSACFYPKETIDSVRLCAELGFSNVEIFMNSFSELEMPYLRRLKELCQERSLKVTSIHPFTSGYEYMLFFSAYEKRAADSCGLYARYFSAAAELGADFVVFHGDSVRAPFIGLERYAEVYSMLADTAKREGAVLLQENVSSARSGSAEFILELRKMLPDIGFVLDIKQVLRAGQAPEKMITAMGDRIKHIHINDWCFNAGEGREDGCRLPGKGELELGAIVKMLEDNRYDGRYMIEVYRKNFTDLSDISESFEYLRRL